MTWVDIPLTDIDSDSPVKEDLLTQFYDNLIELLNQSLLLKFEEVSVTSATYVNVFNGKIFIPPCAASTARITTVHVGIQHKQTGGTNHIMRARLNAGAYSTTSLFSNTSYGQDTMIEIIAGDVTAAAGTLADLEIEMRKDGGGTGFIRSLGGTTHLKATG